MRTHNYPLQKGLVGNTGMIPQPGSSKRVVDEPNSIKSFPQLPAGLQSRFQVSEKLGSGSFGHIFRAFDSELSDYVALKIEMHNNNNNEGSATTLRNEAKILAEIGGAPGIPNVYLFIKEDSYSMLEIELLGPNLEKLFRECNRKFSLKTTLLLAEQMLKRIEYAHSRGYLHRDIKPENFIIGNPGHDPHTLYLIDFGLSKMYRDSLTGKHISYKENRGLVGTARYASISTHLGIEQSRRDDLESIGYLLIYFIKGSLPWQNIRTQSKAEKYKLIAESKMTTSVEELCKGIPKEFVLYMSYVRNLTFSDAPDYKYLKGLFRRLLTDNDWGLDYEYDWQAHLPKYEAQFSRGNDANGQKKQLRKNITVGNKVEEELVLQNANLKTSFTSPYLYPKQQPSSPKADDSYSPTRQELKKSGFINQQQQQVQTKKNNVQVIKKNNFHFKSSFMRHSNSFGGPNIATRLSWNQYTPSKEADSKKTVTRKVPLIDLSKSKIHENMRLKTEADLKREDSQLLHYNSFTGTMLSPAARSSRNIMPEKPIFTVCCEAIGEHDGPESFQPSLEVYRPMKPVTKMHTKSLANPKITIKGLLTNKHDDFDFVGDEMVERRQVDVVIYDFPKTFTMKELGEAVTTRRGQNTTPVPHMLGSANTLKDYKAMLRNSVVSTGTEMHKISILGE